MRINKIICFIFIICFLIACDNNDLLISNTWHIKFEDDFEDVDTNWSIFEEKIASAPDAYGTGIGLVINSQNAAYQGERSLCVWANEQKSPKSNHVLAQYQYSANGKPGKWRFEVKCYIPSATVDNLQRGQVGPEFSVQNTREVAPGIFKTSTAGIQYLANPTMAEYGSWYIWHEAAWVLFFSPTDPLETDTWYTIALEADYDTNSYIKFEITNDKITLSYDLGEYSIAQEQKPGFASEGFWLTCESENIWGEPNTDYRVNYDNAILKKWY